MTSSPPWIAAHEGFYGPPLEPEAREDLIRWLPRAGYDAYVYSPKDDPYQRARWREPYPAEDLDRLRHLGKVCAEAGVELGLTISPGLDWQLGVPSELDALTGKVEQLLTTGAAVIGIAWDDTPGEGETVGADHGRAVAEVATRLARAGVRWMTCPVDYAVETPTAYLRAFAATIGDDIDMMWTGPSVVTAHLGGDQVDAFVGALGRPVVYAENFPVNDLGMSGVLHLGPYPDHEPGAMAKIGGVLVNFMSLPLASRVGLAQAARAWRQPESDRQTTWQEVIADHPGLRPLARACRAWLDHTGPEPTLLDWARSAGADDRRLRDFLGAGCRDGLDPALAAEMGPWLDAWEREAEVMGLALDILETGEPPTFVAAAKLAVALRSARKDRHQVFGTRWAIYPSTSRNEANLYARPDAIVDAANLTDLVVARALRRGRERAAT